MEDVIIDCGALVEKCKECGAQLDWEGDWYGCPACKYRAALAFLAREAEDKSSPLKSR
jgi:hypothetical protein